MGKIALPKCFGVTKHMEWVSDPTAIVKWIEDDFAELQKHESANGVSTVAGDSVKVYALVQMGCKLRISQKVACETAIRCAKIFFSGEKEYQKQIKEDWTRCYGDFFLSATLATDMGSLEFLSEWLSLKRKVVADWDPNTAAGAPILFAIADLFRQKPFGEAAAMKMGQAKCSRSMKLLIEATKKIVYQAEATESSKLFAESLQLHAKTVQMTSLKERLAPIDLVAVHHSIVWNAALLKGFQLASPSKELLPFLVTKKCLGL